MIPKSLLAAWLSLQQMCGSPHPHDSNSISAATVSHGSAWEHDQYSVERLHHVDMESSNVHVVKMNEINFEDIPSGDWDQSTILQGNIQLQAPTATRIWSVKDAFPNLKLKYGGNHAWGAYPAGQNVTVHVAGGTHPRIGGTFGYVLNGQLAPFSWKVLAYKDGKLQSHGTGDVDTGRWVSLNTVAVADSVYFLSTAGDPTGLLLMEDIVYDD